MEVFASPQDLDEFLRRCETTEGDGALRVTRPAEFRNRTVDSLVWSAVFGPPPVRDAARLRIRQAAASLGILPASILPLYKARGRGEITGFTVPAVNIRMLAYDSSRAAFRAARSLDAGLLIFEIARSEIGYTEQRPAEYAAVVLGAAIREGWEDAVFLQGDHYQTNPKKMKENPEKEISAIEALIEEAIPAGFFQIDIDTSTLVDLSKPTLEEQQRQNFELAARFTKFIRAREPKEMPISVGGEIGEVGKENSTPEELRAYMEGYLEALGGGEGIAKVSIQTGSSHGGIVGPDGKVKRVAIDFETLRRISRVAREEYGMAGAVQHGASTLPPEFFGHFPDSDCAEIHLATEFQNMVYEHPSLPLPLKRETERWLFRNKGEERKRDETESQFLYNMRKFAIGPFKEQFWNLPDGTREAIADSLEKRFHFLFEKLRVAGSRELVARHIQPAAGAIAASGDRFVRDDQAGD